MARKITVPLFIFVFFITMLSLGACSLMRWDNGSAASSKTASSGGKTASGAASSAGSNAAATSSTSTALRDYTNAQYSMSLSYPADWQLSEGVSGCVCVIKAPLAQGSDISATVTAQGLSNTKQTLYSLNDTTLTHLSSSVPKFTQIANDEIKMAGGFGYKIDYTTVQSNVTQRVVKYLCIVNSRQYMLTCTAPADSYDNYALQFSNLLKSIIVKE